MKFLHTSDWHLGRSLYGRKRYAEFAAFLDWLGDTIEAQQVDCLLVAGDVFDTSTPGNRAQELYYRFLYRVSRSCCRHIVIIGGNHDSPTFLNAPAQLLQALNVYVVGAISDDIEDEVLVLRDGEARPQAIVCAVPYLRDKDIRRVEAGESIEDKNARMIEGVKSHYAAVCALAELRQAEFVQDGGAKVPIIGMGHLFTAGGKTLDGDGVRELYVGSLAHVGADVFPACLDYLALGHLHVPQRVGGKDHFRYSGSPIPMGYGEAGQEKKVILLELTPQGRDIEALTVPCFQALERLTGSLDEIFARLEQLKQAQSNAWLEIEYTGTDIVSHLGEQFAQAIDGTEMEIRRIRNQRQMERIIARMGNEETLDDLDAHDVFERCLDAFKVPSAARSDLLQSYQEIITEIQEQDRNAE